MIMSMTGFGSATGDVCGYHCRIEIKTLNNRFKEFVFRSPHILCQLEESLKKQINSQVHRGRIELWITVEEGPQTSSTLNLNLELAKAVHAHLVTVKDELGIDEPITLEHILKHNVITVDKTSELVEADNEAFLEGVLDLNEKAIGQLLKMRETEGRRLTKDLLDRLANISVWLDELAKLAETVPLAATKRYQARMEELAETILDPNRLYQEAVIMAEKMDITEEITRFGSHILGLKSLLDNSDEPVGRRLEFLLQEIGREINTIGSKSQSKNIIDLVVNVKSELEKIREQCMNIE
ncbi:MAG: YicC family protein [Deltaproteobacteria bacterium]|jgi:uncharacterized protein (TIGR00255 family)|nr:YicC family protein [Deltaproteobacteria bacterium]